MIVWEKDWECPHCHVQGRMRYWRYVPWFFRIACWLFGRTLPPERRERIKVLPCDACSRKSLISFREEHLVFTDEKQEG